MSNFTRVLALYDGSFEAKATLQRADAFVKRVAGQLHVLVVVDATSMAVPLDDAYAMQNVWAHDLLHEALSSIKTAHTNIQGHVAFGGIVENVVQHTEKLDADLVFIGHRPRSLLSEWWCGPPTYASLIKRAGKCAVVTVNVPKRLPR